MNADARAGERDAAGPRNDQAVEGIITLEGDLTRSGIYQLPRHSRLNVLQLIAASGGLEGRPAESLRIRLIRGHEVEAVTESFRYVDLTANPRLVPVLLPGDRVIVETDESGA